MVACMPRGLPTPPIPLANAPNGRTCRRPERAGQTLQAADVEADHGCARLATGDISLRERNDGGIGTRLPATSQRCMRPASADRTSAERRGGSRSAQRPRARCRSETPSATPRRRCTCLDAEKSVSRGGDNPTPSSPADSQEEQSRIVSATDQRSQALGVLAVDAAGNRTVVEAHVFIAHEQNCASEQQGARHPNTFETPGLLRRPPSPAP